ncbi:hypothetical protein C471_01509 [Halorubrum saccharovorum DSM 1137]|uniref:Uncharacterized protein n=1 Tax=Halorubrum saccharovorum DSM 1137 TaxID=1227484 RepID=M0E7W5_9EURY|nr:hypothetical protein C471_01509 [Halorubrum saccharovorum DSM 1137]
MANSPRDGPSFSVTHESDPSDVLVAGFSSFGLAGLTAVDYLVENLDLEQTGHVRAEEFPSITPFEKGRPRRHYEDLAERIDEREPDGTYDRMYM